MSKKNAPASPNQVEPSMSDILVAFATPMLSPDMSAQAYEAALKLAAAIWNLAFLSAEKFAAGRTQLLDRFTQGSPREALMMANTIDNLIHSRKQIFAFDSRFITGVAVVHRKGRWDVQTDYVPATFPGEGAPPAGDIPANG